MTDLEKQAASGATPDYIAIIKAAKEHNVLHLEIGSFKITMQAPARDSLSRLSQLAQPPQLAPNYVIAPMSSPGVSTTSTAEIAKPAKAALEKLHAKRKQFDDFRNMKPPSSNGSGASDE